MIGNSPSTCLLEHLDHRVALLPGHAPMKKSDLAAKPLLQMGTQHRAHFGELGEDEGALVAL